MPKIYKIFFFISVSLIVISFITLFVFGLKFGIDFTGGSILELEFQKESPQISLIRNSLIDFNLGAIEISSVGDRGVIIKMPEISDQTHQKILNELEKIGPFEEKRFDSIGPSLGKELGTKSIQAIIITLILITVYLTIVFRKISKVINPIYLSFGAFIALIHDIILPIFLFVLLGKFKGVEINAPLIAAGLIILGYSINDTIIVYDRIRENIIRNPAYDFNQIVHKSIKQTLSRSINTTLTTLFPIIAIYIFGGYSLKNFSSALIIGIISGAYSSIFVASPILMILNKKK